MNSRIYLFKFAFSSRSTDLKSVTNTRGMKHFREIFLSVVLRAEVTSMPGQPRNRERSVSLSIHRCAASRASPYWPLRSSEEKEVASGYLSFYLTIALQYMNFHKPFLSK